ncbi:MAG TPA: sulfurtransferase, partial [Variovorax sp.]|nr:sulfurtransferase [Variovorax sp.]
MAYATLISANELQALQRDKVTLMVFDCSFDLAAPDAGERKYREAHIPGAIYVNLDTDLSAKHGAPGKGGVVIAQKEAGAPASG